MKNEKKAKKPVAKNVDPQTTAEQQTNDPDNNNVAPGVEQDLSDSEDNKSGRDDDQSNNNAFKPRSSSEQSISRQDKTINKALTSLLDSEILEIVKGMSDFECYWLQQALIKETRQQTAPQGSSQLLKKLSQCILNTSNNPIVRNYYKKVEKITQKYSQLNPQGKLNPNQKFQNKFADLLHQIQIQIPERNKLIELEKNEENLSAISKKFYLSKSKTEKNYSIGLIRAVSAKFPNFGKEEFKKELECYYEKLEVDEGTKLYKFKTFFTPKEYSSTSKKEAVRIMLAHLGDVEALHVEFKPEHISALRDSRLGRIIEKYEQLGLLPQKFKEAESAMQQEQKKNIEKLQIRVQK